MSSRRRIKSYWTAYGGTKALLCSPYLWTSLGLSATVFPSWIAPGWWETTVPITSSMLGFTLAGFAILIGFGDERFRKLLSRGRNGKAAPLLQTAAAFVHFILVQLLALGLGVISKFLFVPAPDFIINLADHLGIHYKSWCDVGNRILWFSGVFSFFYSCLLGLAATFWIFELCSSYVAVEQRLAEMSKEKNKPKPHKE